MSETKKLSQSPYLSCSVLGWGAVFDPALLMARKWHMDMPNATTLESAYCEAVDAPKDVQKLLEELETKVIIDKLQLHYQKSDFSTRKLAFLALPNVILVRTPTVHPIVEYFEDIAPPTGEIRALLAKHLITDPSDIKVALCAFSYET